MPTVEGVFLCKPLRAAVSTRAAIESPMVRRGVRGKEWPSLKGRQVDVSDYHDISSWDAITEKLNDWAFDPTELDDDGTITPSMTTIQQAIDLAIALGEKFPAPTRVVPDAHGGIVFELQSPDAFESVHINADGSVEQRLFKNSRLVHRVPWVFGNRTNE